MAFCWKKCGCGRDCGRQEEHGGSCYCRIEDHFEKPMMNAHIRKTFIWEVRTNSDKDEGRGRIYFNYFLNESKAREFAKGEGPWGSDADVRRVEEDVLMYDGKHYLLGDVINNEGSEEQSILERAIAKLTDEEKKALAAQGLKL